MNETLMYAILSMDSYNRGYNANIFFGDYENGVPVEGSDIDGISIGTANIKYDSNILKDINENPLDEPIDFYALAYDYNGETVISYRGTDNFPLDFYYGYGVGSGLPDADQGAAAFAFYNAVAILDNGGFAIDPRLANISVTGHSLGGGLAGLVGAVYGKEGALFDNMRFEAAAMNSNVTAAINTSYKNLVYGTEEPWTATISDDPDVSLLHTYSLDDELIAFQRIGQQTPETVYSLPGDPNLRPYLPDNYDLHSMAALVIHMFAETELAGQTSWHAASPYFWPILFQNDFARSVGENAGASVLTTKIAYSAIDNGTTIFGDTAIRALYNDANDLGEALQAAQASPYITAYASEISQVFVHYAGLLALHKRTWNDLYDTNFFANYGVLWGDYNNASLSLSFSNIMWALNKDVPGDLPEMFTRTTLISHILAEAGLTDRVSGWLQQAYHVTGDALYTPIEEVTFGVDSSGGTALSNIPETDPDKALLYVGTDAAEVLSASNNSILLGMGGDDLFKVTIYNNGARQNYFIDGGAGNDTLNIYSLDPLSVISQKTGGIFYKNGVIDVNISSIENVISNVYTHILLDPEQSLASAYSLIEKYYSGNLYVSPGPASTEIFPGRFSLDFSQYTAPITFSIAQVIPNPDGGPGYRPPDTYSSNGRTEELFLGHPGILYGSNHGDTIYYDWVGTGYSEKYQQIQFHLGSGNDTFIMDPEQKSGWDYQFDIYYNGGDDYYKLQWGVRNIYLTEDIILSDINAYILENKSFDIQKVRLDIANYGSITVDYGPSWWAGAAIHFVLESGGDISFDFSKNLILTTGSSTVPSKVTGGWGDDEWISRAGYDQTYYGLGGDDTIILTEGRTTVYGGVGNDSVVLSQAYSDYTLTNKGTYWSITDKAGTEGTDTLYDIEYLRFADGKYDVANGVFTVFEPRVDVPVGAVYTYEGGVSLRGLADSTGINIGSYLEKTQGIAFETGADVKSAQVLYEQGGGTRGLNLFIENGRLYAALWNRAEENWGYQELSADIRPHTRYTATLVMDGSLSADGTADLYLNGVRVDGETGIGKLYGHTDDIGIGQVAQTTVLHGSTTSDAAAFSGSIEALVQYNTALSGNDLQQLHAHLAQDWLSDTPLVPERVVMEFGSVVADHNAVTVALDHHFDTPVVLMTMTSLKGGQLAVPRITDVQSDGFTFYAQEAEYLDGSHAQETFSYIVVEAGSWTLSDGTRIEAGILDTNQMHRSGWEHIDFAASFAETPAIFTQIQSDNDPVFAATRQQGAEQGGFNVALQEEELFNTGTHGTEQIGWLAIEQGTGSDDGFEFWTQKLGDTFTQTWTDILFDASIDTLPQFLVSLSSTDGTDPSFVRANNLSAEGVRLQIQEDQSKDSEVAHTTETLDIFTIEGTGQLTAIPSEFV